MIDRRSFLASTGAVLLAAPRVVWAQQARTDSPLVQVGVLGFGSGMQTHVQNAFRESLAELGYVEGQNLEIDRRYANGRREKVPGLLAELLALRVRVLVVVGPYVLKTTKNAGTDTPIVAIDFESDPVAAGFVKSLAIPGET